MQEEVQGGGLDGCMQGLGHAVGGVREQQLSPVCCTRAMHSTEVEASRVCGWVRSMARSVAVCARAAPAQLAHGRTPLHLGAR